MSAWQHGARGFHFCRWLQVQSHEVVQDVPQAEWNLDSFFNLATSSGLVKVGSASLQSVTDQVQVTNHLLGNVQFFLQDQVMTKEAERLDGNLLDFDVRSKAV